MAHPAHKGRGALSSPAGRFSDQQAQLDPEAAHELALQVPATVLTAMPARSIISHNNSPDIPFERSINPYQGCEHGCIYCYARPSHSYLDLSPGLDFETKIFFKPNAATLLVAEWQKPAYECKPITIGANTDPYQPADRSLELTRKLLRTFAEYRHPVNLITKSHLIERDIDLLADLARDNLASVAVSIPTMNPDLKRIMEPRVPAAGKRLEAIRRLTAAGIPVSLLLAPVIPAINDREIESILEAAADAGAGNARYIFLRLPHELESLFTEWLQGHFPDRAAHVMSLMQQSAGGKSYDARFGIRQTGSGPYAEMLGARFAAAAKRHALDTGGYQQSLDCSQFLHPAKQQLGLPF